MRDREIVGLHQAYLDVYSNLNYNQDIVEVATEYFYTYGLNEDGIDILIEKVGLDNFVEFVYDLSEDLTILTEERSAKRRTGGEPYADVLAKINAKEAAKKKAKEKAKNRNESERVKPGADTESKEEQPKSKKPEKSGIARAISGVVQRARQDTELLKKSWNTAREVGRGHEANVARAAGTVAGAAHGAAKVAHRLGQEAGKSETGKKIKKVLFGEEVEAWVNQLVEEGYDLSEYTWDEMAEYIIEYMSDEEFELLNEARTQKPWSETKIKRFNKEIERQKKQRKRTPSSSLRPADQAALKRMLAGDPPPEPISNEPSPSPSPSRSGRRTIPRSDLSNIIKSEFDPFDAILEHLIAEGYADTNESALAIMANMSEEWRESIVEGPGGMMMSAASQGKGRIVKTQPERGPRPSQSGSAMGRKPVDPSRRLQPPVGATVNRYDSAGKPYTHIQK